jgi:hypothetical protein
MGMDSIKRTIKEAPTRLTELQVRTFPSLSRTLPPPSTILTTPSSLPHF